MTHDEQGTADRADELAERIEGVLAAAESAAAAIRAEAAAVREAAERDAIAIRADAEADAERVLADARREARQLVNRATELVRRLDQSPAAEPAPAAPPARARLDSAEEARLMALQMAMAGRTRAEVESDLRHGLHMDAPEAILDDVFGKGTRGDQRIPWSRAAKGEAV